MATSVKFGPSQFMNAAPAFIGRIKRVLNFMSAGVVLYLPFLAKQFNTDIDTLTTFLGFFMLAFNSVALFFGVPLSDNEAVKGADVTEVETGS